MNEEPMRATRLLGQLLIYYLAIGVVIYIAMLFARLGQN